MKLTQRVQSRLRVGDPVMVISGGNKKKRPNIGKVGKLIRFCGESNERVIVEGVNFETKHTRAQGPGKASGRIQREGSIHISNVMFYAEKLKKPVRLAVRTLEDGSKVRGYIDPQSKKFEQIEVRS